MPMSGANSGTLPGMTLKAWAHVSSAGVLLKGMNVSSVTYSAGSGTINFSNALATANYVWEGKTRGWIQVVTKSTTSFNYSTVNESASSVIVHDHYIAVYE